MGIRRKQAGCNSAGRHALGASRSSRFVVGLGVLALLAAACSGADDPAPTTTAPATTAPPIPATTVAPTTVARSATATIEEALGGTQAVQDFAIFVGMWHESGERSGTFYSDVLDVADEGSVTLGELSGGFSLQSADALTGVVVDRDRNPIPSLRADYGLMVGSQDVVGDAVGAWAAESDPDGSLGLADLFDTSNLDGPRLLVEVITADYTESRTHAGPGDLALMDLSGVQSVAPGDDVAMSYFFGQTYPGDPEVERSLAPLDLFRYRWNRGLVAVLSASDGGGGEAFPDRSVQVVDGSALAANQRAPHFQATLAAATSSTVHAELAAPGRSIVQTVAQSDDASTDSETGLQLSEREIKQLILLDFLREEQERRTEAIINDDENDLIPLLEGRVDNDGICSPTKPDDKCQYVFVDPDENEVILVDEIKEPDPDCGFDDECYYDPDDVVAETTFEEYASQLAAEDALRTCGEKAAELNRRNEAQTALSDIGPSAEPIGAADALSDASNGSGGDDASNGSGDEEDETDSAEDPLAPQPGPVSCGLDFPSGPPKLPDGMAWGDIHVATIDGKVYANQAVGEFLLFDNGVAEVQMRTEPWAGASAAQVSVATAFAARLGDHEISMHADGSTYIDGEDAELSRGETIAIGGGELLWWDQGWVVVWPDGTVLRAQISAASQRAQVTPALGASIGLFGDFDGNPDNDFFTRDGELLPPDVNDDFETFYGTYVDSWRITDVESAFFYEEGERTGTFTDRDFPTRAASTSDLPAETRAEAEELCRRVGVTMEQVFDACVLDVGATGEVAFAYQAYLTQQATPEPGERPTATPAPAGSGPNTLIIGDTLIGFGPSPPVVDASGAAPKWTCEVSDGVFTVINSFTESPLANYELNIQYIAPGNARGLDEAFRLIVRRNRVDYAWVQTIAEQFADAVDSAVLEGAVLTVEGEMYVNDPPSPGLGPINPLPTGSELMRFTLQSTCGE